VKVPCAKCGGMTWNQTPPGQPGGAPAGMGYGPCPACEGTGETEAPADGTIVVLVLYDPRGRYPELADAAARIASAAIARSVLGLNVERWDVDPERMEKVGLALRGGR